MNHHSCHGADVGADLLNPTRLLQALVFRCTVCTNQQIVGGLVSSFWWIDVVRQFITTCQIGEADLEPTGPAGSLQGESMAVVHQCVVLLIKLSNEALFVFRRYYSAQGSDAEL